MRTMQRPMTRRPGPRRALSCVRCSTRAAARTSPVEMPSNSVPGTRSCVSSVETEVTDGLYLVVTGRVLHRLFHRDADHGTDVHVGFPVRAVGANSKTRASRVVGRLLTREDWRADTAQSWLEEQRHVALQQFRREPGIRPGSFFDQVQTHCQQQRRAGGRSQGSDSVAGTR
jgi:hypothetical protein